MIVHVITIQGVDEKDVEAVFTGTSEKHCQDQALEYVNTIYRAIEQPQLCVDSFEDMPEEWIIRTYPTILRGL